ncbi:oxidoreductase [Amycolatopsis sp. GM8]|uniref:oxidoreductase n=1 Tax=Amycolatopsis sp. GM8 TaxID=2896530 RepID=UPI001F0289F7|nr:oxidoreductase [Amycolatopsis sp. GM8]
MISTDFTDIRALVTGGTRGIGAATVHRLLAGGARVAAVARHAAAVPDGVHLIVADVSAPDGASDAAEQALSFLGGIDVLVNNAGSNISVAEGPLAADDALWEANLDLNLMAAVRLDRLVVPSMVTQGHGTVIHVSSGAARYPQHTGLPYAAAKAALNVYSKGLANAVAPSGVRVVAVMPGFVETDSSAVAMQEMADRRGITLEALRADLRERFSGPLGRPGRGEEAAEVIAFLASSRASYLTGIQVPLDGGLHPTM